MEIIELAKSASEKSWKLDQWSSSCIADDDFSAWIRAIQTTSILQPASEDAC